VKKSRCKLWAVSCGKTESRLVKQLWLFWKHLGADPTQLSPSHRRPISSLVPRARPRPYTAAVELAAMADLARAAAADAGDLARAGRMRRRSSHSGSMAGDASPLGAHECGGSRMVPAGQGP
jgi:hypothetical protein